MTPDQLVDNIPDDSDFSGNGDVPENVEYSEYLQQLQQQHSDNLSRIGFDGSDKFLADEVNYTHEIITDEVGAEVRPALKNLLLKVRTVRYIDRLMLASTTCELVINNFSERDIYGGKIGVKKNTLYALVNISGLERKYNDVDSMLVYNSVHHRTKVTRSRGGFERDIQKTNIVKSHVVNPEKPNDSKSGISRYIGFGRRG